MSLHRRAAKRDANEPAIVSALETLGCVVWRVSGKGLPDLVVFYRSKTPSHLPAARVHKTFVADVKGPKDGPTPAQVEAWTALTNLGFSVFILRTPEDAQKMLNNALRPWEPEVTGSIRAPRSHGYDRRPHKGDAAKAREEGRKRLAGLNGRERLKEVSRRLRAGEPVYGDVLMEESYTPPRQLVDGRPHFNGLVRKETLAAAKEAEATFAPTEYVGVPCSRHAGACSCAPCQSPGCIHKGPCPDAPAEPRRSKVCLDPDKMNGAGDQFPGSDYD